MKRLFIAGCAAFLAAAPAGANSDLQDSLAGALKGCEEWVLNPASWAEGYEPFLASVGLGAKMGLVDTVNPSVLPPEEYRVANRYWRINATEAAGYYLVVSDRLPICHITGGGQTDLQPEVEAVLESDAFAAKWEEIAARSQSGLNSTLYRHREEPKFTILISRAVAAGGRLGRVQVLATAQMLLE